MPVLWTYVYNVLWFLWKLSLLHIIWLNWNQSLSFSLMNSFSFCPSTRKRNMMQLCVSDVSSSYLNFLQVFISCWLQLWLNKVQWPYRSLSIGVGFTKTMIFYSLNASTFLELIEIKKYRTRCFPGGSVVKNPPANEGDTGSNPDLGRYPSCHGAAKPVHPTCWAVP